MMIYIKYLLTISLLLPAWSSRSQTAVKKTITYDLVRDKKLLRCIDSFDLKGNVVLKYIYRGYSITSTGDEESKTTQPQVIRHFEYDQRGRLVKDYNEYPGGRKASPAFYEWTDTTLTGYEKREDKDEKIKMWQYTLNGYGDTVQFLHYDGPTIVLTSGERFSLIYDKNKRLIDKKKYVLQDPSKMIWTPTGYRERFFYSGVLVYPDSVYNCWLDSDSLIFTLVCSYTSKGQLKEKIYKNKNQHIDGKVNYTYCPEGIQKMTENMQGMKPRAVNYSYDSKGRVKEMSVMEEKKVVHKYRYVSEYY